MDILEMAIKQENGEVGSLIKAEAKKRNIYMKDVAERMGIRMDIFYRKLISNYIDIKFVKNVLKQIDVDLWVSVDILETSEVIVTIEKI